MTSYNDTTTLTMMFSTTLTTTRVAARVGGARAMRSKKPIPGASRAVVRAVSNEDESESDDASSIVALVTTDAEEEPTTTMTYELRSKTPPKRFTVAEGQLLNVATAAAPLALRLSSGLLCHGYSVKLAEDDAAKEGEYAVFSAGGRRVVETSLVGALPRPEKPLKLYQFQGCPFCRKVREAIVSLDLDVVVFPTPKDGPEYREFVRAEGGKAQFPYLIDENTGTKMYESDEIIAYLFETYGPGKANVDFALNAGALTSVTAGLGMLPRLGKGSAYKPSKKPTDMKPIVFWAYEASPFCVLVAEKLCELELPYMQRTCGRGSPKRQELFEKRGTFQVPYIEDPNTGIAMFESADIIAYLEETYAA
jgi:glutathione S-transferase